MATPKKEEERNERIIRGLLKLPPNRRCINCNSLGPQYVCTSFWTFICISCSGIHREFTHRVKSVSMSKFTTQEVEALQKGGNQRARESFLKDFDTQQIRLPDSSNVDNLREFIKAVYVERRYGGGRFSERPPRDTQNQKDHEEHRRASSYHSFSQSPPYDYQYEERHNGKQTAVLSRKPGSDRGYDGNISGFAYSPRSLHEKMSEDRFANESCGSRISDCSGSSVSDTFRTAPQSPNLVDNGCNSPPAQQAEPNVRTSNEITCSERTASTGSLDSTILKSANSSLAGISFEPENGHGTQQIKDSIPPSFAVFSDAVNAANDLFNLTVVQLKQPVTALDLPMDLFANMESQPLTAPSADKVPSLSTSLDSVGWATFDTPLDEPRPGVIGISGGAATSKERQTMSHDLFSLEPNKPPTGFQASEASASFTNQSFVPSCEHTKSIDTSSSQLWSVFDDASDSTQKTSPGALSLMNSISQERKGQIDGSSFQLWHSFDDVSGLVAHDQSSAHPQTNEHKNGANMSLTTSNPFTCSESSEESYNYGSQRLSIYRLASNDPLASFIEPSASCVIPAVGGTSADQQSLNPFDLPFETDSETLSMFMDVGSLQQALPNSDLPTAFLDSLPETWFANNAAAYAPSGSHGGLPCLVEQVPTSPLRNMTVRAISTGNPFA